MTLPDHEMHGVLRASPLIPGGGGKLPTRIVLRKLGSEYVTHLRIYREDKSFDHAWGHYFLEDEEAAAHSDFKERVARGY